MTTTWTRILSRPAYTGFVRVRRDTYREPDGTVSEWDVLDASDSAAVLAFTPDAERAIFFEQFRVGPEQVLREIPGGAVNPGEDALSAALRELREETGYVAGAAFDAGGEWFTANSNRRKHVVVAADATKVGNPSWDTSEMGTIRLVETPELLEILLSGDLTDAGTACRGLLAFLATRLEDPRLVQLQSELRPYLVDLLRGQAEPTGNPERPRSRR